MAARSKVVAISALTRINSLRSTSCVSARSKSADTAERCPPLLLPHNVGIAFPGHSGMVGSTRPQMCNCPLGNLEIPGSLIALVPRNDGQYSASIARATEARHGDRHRQQHQRNERDGAV